MVALIEQVILVLLRVRVSSFVLLEEQVVWDFTPISRTNRRSQSVADPGSNPWGSNAECVRIEKLLFLNANSLSREGGVDDKYQKDAKNYFVRIIS